MDLDTATPVWRLSAEDRAAFPGLTDPDAALSWHSSLPDAPRDTNPAWLAATPNTYNANDLLPIALTYALDSIAPEAAEILQERRNVVERLRACTDRASLRAMLTSEPGTELSVAELMLVAAFKSELSEPAPAGWSARMPVGAVAMFLPQPGYHGIAADFDGLPLWAFRSILPWDFLPGQLLSEARPTLESLSSLGRGLSPPAAAAHPA